MDRISRQLSRIGAGIPEKDAKRAGIPVADLVSRGLLRRYRTDQKKYLVPEGVPRWATKFRHSRKKYGVEEHVIESIIIKLTDRGSRYIKSRSISKTDKIDEPVMEDINQKREDDDDGMEEFGEV